MGEVVELIAQRAGFACADREQMREWAMAWVDALIAGEYGAVQSLVIVAETDRGVASVVQSLAKMDGVRTIGLLTLAAHRRIDGVLIEDLRADGPR